MNRALEHEYLEDLGSIDEPDPTKRTELVLELIVRAYEDGWKDSEERAERLLEAFGRGFGAGVGEGLDGESAPVLDLRVDRNVAPGWEGEGP